METSSWPAMAVSLGDDDARVLFGTFVVWRPRRRRRRRRLLLLLLDTGAAVSSSSCLDGSGDSSLSKSSTADEDGDDVDEKGRRPGSCISGDAGCIFVVLVAKKERDGAEDAPR